MRASNLQQWAAPVQHWPAPLNSNITPDLADLNRFGGTKTGHIQEEQFPLDTSWSACKYDVCQGHRLAGIGFCNHTRWEKQDSYYRKLEGFQFPQFSEPSNLPFTVVIGGD